MARKMQRAIIPGYTGSLSSLPDYIQTVLQGQGFNDHAHELPLDVRYERMNPDAKKDLYLPPENSRDLMSPEPERCIMVRYDGEVTEINPVLARNMQSEINKIGTYKLVWWDDGNDGNGYKRLREAFQKLSGNQKNKVAAWYNDSRLLQPGVNVTSEWWSLSDYQKSNPLGKKMGVPGKNPNQRYYPDEGSGKEPIPLDLPSGYVQGPARVEDPLSGEVVDRYCSNCIHLKNGLCAIWNNAAVRNDYVCAKWKAI